MTKQIDPPMQEVAHAIGQTKMCIFQRQSFGEDWWEESCFVTQQ
jgi:hypothetical protein